MPLSWATADARLDIPLLVEFRPGGELLVLQAGAFLGEWTEPPESVLGPVQLVSGMLDSLPDSPVLPEPPSFSAGRWKMLDEAGGRAVKFHVEMSGFRRGSIWLPRRKLYFFAKVYGQTMIVGKEPRVCILEDLVAFGVSLGVVLAFVLGPLFLLSLIFIYIRDVNIAVGTWSCERFEGDADNVSLPSVVLRGDKPNRWQ